MRRSSGERGFTVIEAAWTVAILALVILTLALVIGQSIQLNQGADTKARAIDEVERVVESLWGTSFDDLLTTFVPAETEEDGKTYYIATVAVTAEGARLLKFLDGTVSEVKIYFLTEAQAEAEWGQEDLDLDDDQIAGESEAPDDDPSGIDFKAFPVIVRVDWELPDPNGDPQAFSYEARSVIFPLAE